MVFRPKMTVDHGYYIVLWLITSYQRCILTYIIIYIYNHIYNIHIYNYIHYI